MTQSQNFEEKIELYRFVESDGSVWFGYLEDLMDTFGVERDDPGLTRGEWTPCSSPHTS